MPKFISNDTIALILVGAMGIIAVLQGQLDTTNLVVGAIAGFLGAKALEK